MKQVLLRLLNSYTVGFQSTPAGTIAQLIQGFQSYLINPEYSVPLAHPRVRGHQGGIGYQYRVSRAALVPFPSLPFSSESGPPERNNKTSVGISF